MSGPAGVSNDPLARFTVPVGPGRSPIALGLALPPGLLRGAAQVRDAAGDPVPADARPLWRWPDGSVGWLLVELVAPAAGGEDVLLAGRGLSLPALTAPTTPLPMGVTLSLTLPDGTVHAPSFDDAGTVDAGNLRSSRWVRGRLGPVRCEVRTSVWAGTGATRLEIVLHNPRAARHRGGLWDLGDPGSVFFRDVSVRVAAGATPALTARIEAGEAFTPVEAGFAVFQASSGGPRWSCHNHVDASGRVPLAHKGWRAGLRAGLRAQPEVRLGPLAVAPAEFWPNFPQVLAVAPDAASVRWAPFPAEHGAPHELQGGERKRHTLWVCPTGEGLDFVVAPRRAWQDPAEVAATGVLPGLSLPADDTPELHAQMELAVAPATGLAARRELIDEYGWRHWGDLYGDHEAVHATRTFVSHYNNQYDCVEAFLACFLRSGDPRWWALADPLARHVMDIDLYHTTLDRSCYNQGLFWHTDHYADAGTATHRCYSRQNAPARSGSGRLAFGGRNAYGGGLCNEHNYPSGLWLYGLLMGDPWAMAAGRQLADWVLAMDDGQTTLLSVVDRGPTGVASQTRTPDYHGPGRGAGNSINAVCDAWRYTGEVRYLEAAEDLIHRCVHPAQDLDALDLLNAEERWSYVVFIKYLLKYLTLREEASTARPLDAAYAYARACLVRYARFMVAHEQPSTTHPERLEHVTEAWPATDLRKAQVVHAAAAYVEAPERAAMHTWADAFFACAFAELRSYPTHDRCRALVLFLPPAVAQGYYRRHRDTAAPPLPDHTEHTPSGDPIESVGRQAGGLAIGPPPGSCPPAIKERLPPGGPRTIPPAFVPQKARVKRALKTPGGALRAVAALLKPSTWRRVRQPW